MAKEHLVAVKRFDNTAYTEFLGSEICSNTTTTWSAIPPGFHKKVSTSFVRGEYATLTYTIIFENYNEFPIPVPLKDNIQRGGEYVDGSLKLDGIAHTAKMNGNVLTADLGMLAPGKDFVVTFEVDAKFVMHAGQEED